MATSGKTAVCTHDQSRELDVHLLDNAEVNVKCEACKSRSPTEEPKAFFDKALPKAAGDQITHAAKNETQDVMDKRRSDFICRHLENGIENNHEHHS